MLQYILEVTLCWGLFYIIFFGFLRKLTFFSVNRWYLLCTMVLGILIPLLRYVELDIYQEQIAQTLPVAIAVKEIPAQVAITVEEATIEWSSIIYNVLLSLYLIGISFFGARMCRSLYRIHSLYREGHQEDRDHVSIIYTDADHLPFSFFNHVYISRQVDLTENFEEVLQHEIAHVRSYHSIDVLLMELIQICFWFNPMVYIYKTALRQTHEYLADEAVLQNTNRKTYGKMLLKQSLSGLEIALTHRFFHSHIKKRINMMYQKKSGRSAWLKYALALPVLLLLTMAFAQHANSNHSSDSYNTAQLSADINFFCDGAKGSVFPAIFLDDTAENRRISNAKSTHFINSEFFKKINTIYDPAKHFTLFINGKRITNKSQISIDFSKDWKTDYFEIISPEYAKEEYNAPNGVVIIKDLNTDKGSKILKSTKQYGNYVSTSFYPNTDWGRTLNKAFFPLRFDPDIEFPDGLDYFLDGLKVEGQQIKNIDKTMLKALNFYHRDVVNILLQQDSENGRVELITKSIGKEKNRSLIGNIANAELDQIFGQKINVDSNKELAITAESMICNDGMDELLHEINTTHNISQLDIIKNFYLTGIKKFPLIVIDSKTKSMNDLYDLEQKEISAIKMMTSKSAIDKYGNQAKFGAIVINLFNKHETTNNFGSLYPISKYDNKIYTGSNLKNKKVIVSVLGQALMAEEDYEVDENKGVLTIINDKYVDQAIPIKVSFKNLPHLLFDKVKHDNKIYQEIVEMPLFPGCDNQQCSRKKILEHLYRNLKYPESLRKKNIQEIVYVNLTIDERGFLNHLISYPSEYEEINNNIVELFTSLNKIGEWTPRTENGEVLSTSILIPITFKIDEIDEEELNSLKSLKKLPSKKGYDILFDEIMIVGFGNENLFQDDKVYKVVQEMPRFPGCELKTTTPSAKKECADQKLLDYIYDNLKYPKEAMKNKIEGRVYVQFVIEKDGTISNEKIVRDIGGGCGTAALSVIKGMNQLYERWTPGKQQGKVVRVLYTLPVTFKMDHDKNPLLVVNGQVVEHGNIDDIDPASIKTVSVLKDDKAINKYGDQAKNGVVEVILKKVSSDFQRILVPIDLNKKSHEYEMDLFSHYSGDKKRSELYYYIVEYDAELIKDISVNEQGIVKLSLNNKEQVSTSLDVIFVDKDYEFGSDNPIFIQAMDQYDNEPKNFEKMGIADSDLRIIKIASKEPDTIKPLIVIDGQVDMRRSLDDLNADDIESVNVLKGEAAHKKYGNKGENGVVEVVTKEDTQGTITDKNTKSISLPIDQNVNPIYVINGTIANKNEADQFSPDDIKSINVVKGNAAKKKYGDRGLNGVVEIKTKEGTNIKIQGTANSESLNPLYYLDGKKTTKQKIDQLKPDQIKSINVLKGEKALKKYGNAAKNGVIEIESKDKE